MLEIRRVEYADVDDIVSIHLETFKDFFLSSLGEDFLKLYYSCFIANKDGVVLCVRENNEILGFSAVAVNAKSFNARLIKKNFWAFCACGLKLVFTSPMALVRLAKNLTKESPIEIDLSCSAELYSIAVSNSSQGKGLGKMLLSASEECVRTRGSKNIILTTDYYNNSSTIGFYKSMGYRVLCDFISYPNRKMYRFIKEFA